MDIKITANNKEKFEEIEKLLKELPELILSQIELAEYGIIGGLTCHIENKYTNGNSEQRIFLPNYTTQITYFTSESDQIEDYTGIYSDKYFFQLNKKLSEKKPTFVFIDCEVQKEREGNKTTKKH